VYEGCAVSGCLRTLASHCCILDSCVEDADEGGDPFTARAPFGGSVPGADDDPSDREDPFGGSDPGADDDPPDREDPLGGSDPGADANAPDREDPFGGSVPGADDDPLEGSGAAEDRDAMFS
jgi:hypothetical protein